MGRIDDYEPQQVCAGDTLAWTRAFSEYKASDDWTLHYSIKNKDFATTFDAAADGDNFAVNVPADTTGSWPVGIYQLSGWVTSDTERHTVYTGRIQVLPDYSLANAEDIRSYNRRVWENIRAVIDNRATADVQRYMINGRELQKMTIAELKAFEQDYAHRVAKEEGKLPRFLGATWA